MRLLQVKERSRYLVHWLGPENEYMMLFNLTEPLHEASVPTLERVLEIAWNEHDRPTLLQHKIGATTYLELRAGKDQLMFESLKQPLAEEHLRMMDECLDMIYPIEFREEEDEE